MNVKQAEDSAEAPIVVLTHAVFCTLAAGGTETFTDGRSSIF
jgi:hypothetical protein